uniref:Uncharacterized protein n=1 Tax=Triticum urartu TaxID=4572 RepID=A0A8R7JVA4_TRIUA
METEIHTGFGTPCRSIQTHAGHATSRPGGLCGLRSGQFMMLSHVLYTPHKLVLLLSTEQGAVAFSSTKMFRNYYMQART